MKRLFAVAVLFAGLVAQAFEPVDWKQARTVAPGVQVCSQAFTAPRLMKAHWMRVDLQTPGLRFASEGRDPDWGKPMPDYTNGVMLIRTRRETCESFLRTERVKGRNMVAAFNSAPWVPWCAPWNHKFADPSGLNIADGVVLSDHGHAKDPLFVAWKDGRCEIRETLPTNLHAQVAVAHTGFWLLLRDGALTAQARNAPPQDLHPRMALGVSADKRWLYVLAVDGRQPDWSLGANSADLAALLKGAGACDAINMDGGGSTTLLYWDDKAKKAVKLNRHDAAQRHWRANALNIGIWYGEE